MFLIAIDINGGFHHSTINEKNIAIYTNMTMDVFGKINRPLYTDLSLSILAGLLQ